jgi:hypothetical protein
VSRLQDARLKTQDAAVSRGQVSVEFLIILSVTLLAFLIFMGISQSESVGISMTKEKVDASNAVRSMSSAAQEVFSQGAGARKKITVTIPQGFERNQSFIKGNAIKIRSAGQDFVELTDFEVYGTLPLSSGKSEIWVVSEGDRVRIGNSLLEVDRETINVIIGSNDSRTEALTISNPGNLTVKVRLYAQWPHTNVSMKMSDDAFILNPFSSDVLLLSFSSAERIRDAFFVSYLNISATDQYGNEEQIKLPISVEASVNILPQGGPPLVVTPSFFNTTLRQGGSEVKTFQVCTNSETELSSVDFTPTPGLPGNWIGMAQSLSTLKAGTCQAKSLSLNVSSEAVVGNWSGYVYLSGNGAPYAEDVIVLNVKVINQINISDGVGPTIQELSVFPSRRAIFVNDPVAIRVVANDTAVGNNTIELCEVRIDEGPWYIMIPSDGIYDEPVETAGFTYYSGFDSGRYNVSARCLDANNNYGPQGHKTFSVMKEFLFVTENTTPTTEEQAWISFLDQNISNEGYSWNYDVVNSSRFISESLDYYSVIVMERFVNETVPLLTSFDDDGGSIIFLGHSLEAAPEAFNLSNEQVTYAEQSNVNFPDPTHYVTLNVSGKNPIADTNIFMGRIKNFSGTTLVSGPGTPADFHMLAIGGRKHFWGPFNPAPLNDLGTNTTIRLFDYAVNASLKR